MFEPLPQLSEVTSDRDLVITKKIPFGRLEAVRKQLNVTHSALVQALWVAVLQSLYRRGVTVGLILSGRSLDLEGVERTVGPLFNTLPFHVAEASASAAPATWESLVRTCHEFNTATLPFQQVPLRDIQKWCSAGKPLFDTLFSFQMNQSRPQAAAQIWSSVDSDTSADYPLALEASLGSEEDLELLLVVQQGFADESAAARLLDDFAEAAEAMCSNPQKLISDTFSGTYGGIVTADQPDPSGGQEDLEAMNGTISPQLFEWDDTTRRIRDEMALLAGQPAESVLENTSLLELGLDSIDTIKLSARLRSAGISLSNSQLIRGQSLAAYQKIMRQSAEPTVEAPRTSNGCYYTYSPKQLTDVNWCSLILHSSEVVISKFFWRFWRFWLAAFSTQIWRGIRRWITSAQTSVSQTSSYCVRHGDNGNWILLAVGSTLGFATGNGWPA